jgi:hypothetical protein
LTAGSSRARTAASHAGRGRGRGGAAAAAAVTRASGSARAGLMFPVARVGRKMRGLKLSARMAKGRIMLAVYVVSSTVKLGCSHSVVCALLVVFARPLCCSRGMLLSYSMF